MMLGIVESLIVRISIRLTNACHGLDEANSEKMFTQIVLVNDAVRLTDSPETDAIWLEITDQIGCKSAHCGLYFSFIVRCSISIRIRSRQTVILFVIKQ